LDNAVNNSQTAHHMKAPPAICATIETISAQLNIFLKQFLNISQCSEPSDRLGHVQNSCRILAHLVEGCKQLGHLLTSPRGYMTIRDDRSQWWSWLRERRSCGPCWADGVPRMVLAFCSRSRNRRLTAWTVLLLHARWRSPRIAQRTL
jgi:hypothetical protein